MWIISKIVKENCVLEDWMVIISNGWMLKNISLINLWGTNCGGIKFPGDKIEGDAGKEYN